MSGPSAAPPVHFELRFVNLFHPGRGYAFPCDANGEVVWARLSALARHHYLSARERVGRELAAPVVVRRQTRPEAALQ